MAAPIPLLDRTCSIAQVIQRDFAQLVSDKSHQPCTLLRSQPQKKEAILASHRNVLEATTDRRTERVQCLPAHIGSTTTPSKPCHDLSICHKLRVIHALKRPIAIPAISHHAAPCTQYTGEHHTMLWSSSTGRHPSTHNHAGSQVPQKL